MLCLIFASRPHPTSDDSHAPHCRPRWCCALLRVYVFNYAKATSITYGIYMYSRQHHASTKPTNRTHIIGIYDDDEKPTTTTTTTCAPLCQSNTTPPPLGWLLLAWLLAWFGSVRGTCTVCALSYSDRVCPFIRTPYVSLSLSSVHKTCSTLGNLTPT